MEVDICGDATLWSWLRVHMHRILNQDLLLLLDTPPALRHRSEDGRP